MQKYVFTRTSLLVVAFSYTIKASSISEYVVLDETKIQGNWSTTRSVDTDIQCCIACEQDDTCRAANHNADTKTCELWHGSDCLELNSKHSPGWNAYVLNNNGPCFGTLTFSAGWCCWSQCTNDEFDWTRHKGSTGTGSTGPHFDHTSQTSSGYYAYIETSKPRRKGDAAVLKSVLMPANRLTCFSFAYHMYGYSMGRLKVILEDVSNMSEKILLTISGNKGKTWKTQTLNISSDSMHRILVRAERGSDVSSDIAIDDLCIYDGPCS